jgi:hypothetical protein
MQIMIRNYLLTVGEECKIDGKLWYNYYVTLYSKVYQSHYIEHLKSFLEPEGCKSIKIVRPAKENYFDRPLDHCVLDFISTLSFSEMMNLLDNLNKSIKKENSYGDNS